jgi:hypothetical protein
MHVAPYPAALHFEDYTTSMDTSNFQPLQLYTVRPHAARHHGNIPRRTSDGKARANRNGRGFGWEISPRGRFATPADFPQHGCSPYSHVHVRRERLGFFHLGFFHRSRTAPNPNVIPTRPVGLSLSPAQCTHGFSKRKRLPLSLLLKAPTAPSLPPPQRTHGSLSAADPSSHTEGWVAGGTDSTRRSASPARGCRRTRCWPCWGHQQAPQPS